MVFTLPCLYKYSISVTIFVSTLEWGFITKRTLIEVLGCNNSTVLHNFISICQTNFNHSIVIHQELSKIILSLDCDNPDDVRHGGVGRFKNIYQSELMNLL